MISSTAGPELRVLNTWGAERLAKLGTAAYQQFAQDTFTREKALIEKLGLAKVQ